MYRIFSAVTHSTGSIRVAVPQFLKFTSGRFFSESSWCVRMCLICRREDVR